MNDDASRRAFAFGLTAAAATSLIGSAWAAEGTYAEDDIVRAAENFFGAGAEGLGAVVRHVLDRKSVV